MNKIMGVPQSKRRKFAGVSTFQNGTVYDSTFTCKLSTVNGTAFITQPKWNMGGLVNRKVKLEAGGKTLIGWIKAAGTGETLGTELHTSANAVSDPKGNEANAITGWAPYGNHAVTSSSADPSVGTYHFNVAETDVASQGAFYNLNLTSLGLYKLSGNGKNVSGSSVLRIGTSSLGSFLAGITIGSSSYATKTLYATATQIAMCFGFSGVGPLETNVDNVSFKQVLTPSITGVTIVNAQGGSVFNFTSDDGINPNAASFVLTVTES